MFNRLVIKELENWASRENRKPLVLRGARQVGKTTAVNMFAKQFEQYIYLNLDLLEHRRLFENGYNIKDLIKAIFFFNNLKEGTGRKLIFIDEIQNSPSAVAMLRYFYEEASEFYVIAAGSLLESLIDQQISFPVGRVEYCYMKPLTFTEYLEAIDVSSSLEILNQIPIPEFAHQQLLNHFYQYTLIGGMPEIVNLYLKKKNLTELKPIYESLLQAYLDDVEKYARNETLARVMRHAIESSFYSAAERIRFEGFGNSHYKSREMSEALKTLEKAMLIYLVYPATGLNIPVVADYKKSPRLHCLDTGLVNFFVGLQKEIFFNKNIDAVYQGKIAEHIVGQELFAAHQSFSKKVHFWVREKKQSNAQVDYLIAFDNYAVPVEVKAGSSGRLRSLHEFIDRAPHNYAVRIYSGPLKVDRLVTIKGKAYFLLNLPFYLTGQIGQYLDWFLKNYN